MRLRYERDAALKVVANMKTYRGNIENAVSKAVSVASDFSSWRDNKHVEFCNAMSQLIGDIKKGADTISSYSEHLEKKIRQLEE